MLFIIANVQDICNLIGRVEYNIDRTDVLNYWFQYSSLWEKFNNIRFSWRKSNTYLLLKLKKMKFLPIHTSLGVFSQNYHHFYFNGYDLILINFQCHDYATYAKVFFATFSKIFFYLRKFIKKNFFSVFVIKIATISLVLSIHVFADPYIRTESKILSLFWKIRFSKKPYSCIFYAVCL